MNKTLILALTVALLGQIVYSQEAQSIKLQDSASGHVIQFSAHFTLEHALSFDTSTLNTPDCGSQQVIDGSIQALEEWVLLLQNPNDLNADISLLGNVRELIVAAQDSFESVENDFNNSVQLTQLKSRSKVTLQTQVIHKVFTDEMNDILAQIQTLNEQQGEPSELSQLATEILAAIDSLVNELQDLQANQANFSGYIDTLLTKITLAKVIRDECVGADVPVDNTNSDSFDSIVSSATLDDFVYRAIGGDSSQSVQVGGGDFSANSAQLNAFVQRPKNAQGARGRQSRNQQLFRQK